MELAGTSAQAQNFYKADNTLDLSGTGSWVSGTVPTSSGTAIWDNRVSAGNTVNTWSAGNLNWRTITILDPGANVDITFKVSNSKPTIAGVDMSQATRDLTIRNTATSAWQFTLSGTWNVAAGRTLSLRSTTNSQWGTATISGAGTINTDQLFQVFNSGATVTMTNGVLQANNGLTVGYSGSSAFNQSGGAVNVANAQVALVSKATYSLSSGTLNVGADFNIRSDGNVNTLNVTGGVLTHTSGAFTIGSLTTANGLGRYVQSGNSTATVNVLRLNGLASFQIDGGTFSATSWDTLAHQPGTTANLTLAGGTATLPAFPTTRGSGAYAAITFDGGTLRPAAASSTYMQGLNRAYLTGSGAIFDVGSGKDITIAQSLENNTGENGRLTKTGSGTLTLSGSNSHTGSTIVSLGRLTLGNANALGTGATAVSGGELNIATYGPSVSGFTISSGSLTGSGTLTSTNGYTLQGGVVSAILGTGAITVSTGTTTLGSGGRFNSGSGLTIASGQLSLGGNETVADFTLVGGVLAGSGQTLTSDGPMSVQSGLLQANLAGSGGLSKLGSGAFSLSGSNGYTGATVISGGRLTVESVGSLNGTSGITLNGGDFKYNAATTLTPAITFAGAGGTLSGTGTIGSAVTVGTNATLSPGNSPGTQAFTSGLTWNPGGTYVWELNSLSGTAGTNWDLLNVSGGTFDISALSTGNRFNLDLVTLTGSNTAGPLDSGYAAGSTYEFLIASFATLGSGTNNFGANSNLTSLFNISLTGWQGTPPNLSDIAVKVNAAGNGIQLVIVPEPSTLIFGAIAIATVGSSLLRRRRAA